MLICMLCEDCQYQACTHGSSFNRHDCWQHFPLSSCVKWWQLWVTGTGTIWASLLSAAMLCNISIHGQFSQGLSLKPTFQFSVWCNYSNWSCNPDVSIRVNSPLTHFSPGIHCSVIYIWHASARPRVICPSHPGKKIWGIWIYCPWFWVWQLNSCEWSAIPYWGTDIVLIASQAADITASHSHCVRCSLPVLPLPLSSSLGA